MISAGLAAISSTLFLIASIAGPGRSSRYDRQTGSSLAFARPPRPRTTTPRLQVVRRLPTFPSTTKRQLTLYFERRTQRVSWAPFTSAFRRSKRRTSCHAACLAADFLSFGGSGGGGGSEEPPPPSPVSPPPPEGRSSQATPSLSASSLYGSPGSRYSCASSWVAKSLQS